MGYGALGHIEQLGYTANAHLILIKSKKNFYPGGVAKHLVKLGQVVKQLLLWHKTAGKLYGFFVSMMTVNGFCHFITSIYEQSFIY